jgi:tetratricopeptide (TPR) repeat protein
MQLGDYDYSTDCFLRVVDQDPVHAQAFYCLGCALAKREDLDGALQFLEHVLSLDAKFFEARAHAAHLYFKNGQLALAWRTVREALQLQPDHKETRRLARRIAIHRFWYHVKYRLTCFPLYRLKMFTARIFSRVMQPLRIRRKK